MKAKSLLIAASLFASALASPVTAQAYRDRLPEDEVIYFVLPDRFANGDLKNDRGGLKGGPLNHGFDPAHNPVSLLYGARMVDPEAVFVWCWDARPYPAFPDFDTVWTDVFGQQTTSNKPLTRFARRLTTTRRRSD